MWIAVGPIMFFRLRARRKALPCSISDALESGRSSALQEIENRRWNELVDPWLCLMRADGSSRVESIPVPAGRDVSKSKDCMWIAYALLCQIAIDERAPIAIVRETALIVNPKNLGGSEGVLITACGSNNASRSVLLEIDRTASNSPGQIVQREGLFMEPPSLLGHLLLRAVVRGSIGSRQGESNSHWDASGLMREPRRITIHPTVTMPADGVKESDLATLLGSADD